MASRHTTPRFIVLLLVITVSSLLVGCGPSTVRKQTADSPSSERPSDTEKLTPEYESFSDIPTPYPNLYSYDASSGWLNTYDESKVISYSEAYNYEGQDVTVEGTASSIVHAASSSGSPYFINMGSGDFAAVIWRQNITSFDQIELYNLVEWSKSDQPITVTFRISGTVEMYEGRPQITARDGSQIATLTDEGTWLSLMSDNSVNALMELRYS